MTRKLVYTQDSIGEYTIADETEKWVTVVGQVETESDARLFCAAPELLEALRRMLRAGQKQNWNEHYESEMSLASAAIQKATGETKMTLLELLRQELPKRGGWPEGVNFIAQGDGGSVWGFINKPAKDEDDEWMESSRTGTHKLLAHLPEASDRTTAIITREQYESALAAKNDGWIDWGGGECPLKNGTKVDVKDRDGYEHLGEIIGYNNNVDSIFWRHGGVGCPDNEIIAYRLHQPQEAEQTEADDEADLNECIGQDVAPVWNGEGLTPPVGCEYERSWAGDEWQSCKILFTSDQIVVVKLKGSGMEDAYNIGGVTFRPLRTEAERAIDEMVRLSGVSIGAAKILYDAGYRKG